VSVNGARVEQRARVQAEFLGKGTGDPDQGVQLVNTPVLPDSVELTVGGETWTQIDDLVAAPPEVPRGDPRRAPGEGTGEGGDPRVYTLDRASGTIRFGDGLRGSRPPSGAVIQARYDYGGGEQGVVGIGAIQKGPNLPAGVKVTNPISTWGGAPKEAVDEAERRVAEFLRRRDRAVTAGDFAAIAERTPGVNLGRVEVLPLVTPEPGLSDVRAEGVVTVLVIPASDPNRPDAPLPDRLFLDTVCDYLDRRRLLTTEVHVQGPTYKNVYVSVGLDVLPGEDVPPVREAVRSEIRTFLSPLNGGFEGHGWPLQRPVDHRELLTVAARVPGVARVRKVMLAGGQGREKEKIALNGVELPRLIGLSAERGAPTPVDEVYAQTSPSGGEEEDGPPPSSFPVPVVPEEC
jgi:predicted phage baseplate assembly protein